MRRKLIILILALTTSLSVFSGLAALLATGPDSAETAPVTVAEAGPKTGRPPGPPPGGGPSPNGASWGG